MQRRVRSANCRTHGGGRRLDLRRKKQTAAQDDVQWFRRVWRGADEYVELAGEMVVIRVPARALLEPEGVHFAPHEPRAAGHARVLLRDAR